MKLWIDDERPMPADYTAYATNSNDAIALVETHRDTLAVVSFDHDLGVLPDGAGYNDDTSRRVLLHMIENNIWPDVIRFHTANVVGREWLVGMAERYAPAETHIDRTDPYAGRGFENYG